MTAQVSLLRSEVKHALLIPLQAVKKMPDHKQQVQVLNKNNQPQTREITTGISNNIDVQVLSGLKLGEKIVLGHASNDAKKEAIL